MKRLILNPVAITLIGTILGISAWLPFQMIGHVKTHAHHQAATHSAPLCMLFCSAGQMAQITDSTPEFALSYAYNLEPPTFTSHHAIHVSRLLARGPPTS